MGEQLARFRQRIDTAANWTTNDPTMAIGELGFETDTLKSKLGDGVTAWTSLAYLPTGGGVSAHGLLTGLADDDHTQYALADGSRGNFATPAQGTLADNAVPSSALGVTVATLVAGTVPSSQIPAIAITEKLADAADQTAMLALVGQKGDWTIRTDSGLTWVITGDDPTQLSDWTSLSYPGAPVLSVNGQSGVVTLAAADVGAAPIAHVGAGGTAHADAIAAGAAGFMTGADKTKLDAISGTNTGDQSSVTGNAGTATALETARTIDGQSFDGSANITVIAPGTNAAASKTTPVDADQLPLVDSAASNVLKKLTWANIKATLKTYFDTIYAAIAHDQSSDTITTTVLTVSGTTHTAAAGDDGKVYDFTNAGICTVTIPDSLSVGWSVGWHQETAVQPAFTVSGSMVLRNADSHTKGSGQYAMGTLLVTATNKVTLGGKTGS